MSHIMRRMYLVVRVTMFILPFIGIIPAGLFWWLLDTMYDEINENERLIYGVKEEVTGLRVALGESPHEITRTVVLLQEKWIELERTAERLLELEILSGGLNANILMLNEQIEEFNTFSTKALGEMNGRFVLLGEQINHLQGDITQIKEQVDLLGKP